MPLELPAPDLVALVTGDTVVAFVARHAVDLYEEVDLLPSGSRPRTSLQPDYQHLAAAAVPDGEWTALVVGLQPASSLAARSALQHHILSEVPDGDAAILRVFGAEGPVLSDEAFEMARLAAEAAFS